MNVKTKRRWIVFSILLVVVVALNIALNIFSGYADLYLGGRKAIVKQSAGTEKWDSQYYKSSYDSVEATEKAAGVMVEKIESEGIVLLKNDGTLPLNVSVQPKVTVLGRDAADPVYSGSGSGSVDLSSVVNFKSGLTNAGFDVNPAVYDVLKKYASYTEKVNAKGGKDRVYAHPKANIVMDKPEASSYYVGEMPVENYTPSVLNSFKMYNGAAVIMIGRGGGEGGDLARDMKGWDAHYTPGQHELQLNYDEKQLIKLAEENFEKVVVIVNASTQMELGVLKNDPKVNSVLWIGSPGQTGFNAVGKVLSGVVNPSGKTADIYPADFTKDPTFINFGNYQYSNINKNNAIGNAYFVEYEEGIYVGYRYYETAAVENFIKYGDAVVYPFGYGLSYTTFAWQVTGKKLGNTDGTISVDVKVSNTGSTAGKDIVEMYYSAPYYKGGIEKASVVLGDFAKTRLLAPGESQTLTLSIPVESMASYDYKNAKAYVLDKGDYKIRLQSDSHTMKTGVEEITYTVKNTIVYSGDNHRNSDKTVVTNEFDNVSSAFKDEPAAGYARNFSRADFAGTFPTAPTAADLVARDDVAAGWKAYKAADHINKDAVTPVFNKKNGLALINMRGLDYDSPLWDTFLDQLNPDEMSKAIMSAAYNTAELPSLGAPATKNFDGPAGFSSFMTTTHGIAYPSEIVIASSYNTELAKEMGEMVGEEGLALKLQGWYAPAMNTHRSPFSGRNFEYYSEDGLLSGKIAASVVSGCGDKGLMTFIKHFALNDQETNRVNNGIASWANEQAVREIYLKPFEIVVKTAKTPLKYYADMKGTLTEKNMNASTAVMCSFNRIGSTWSGGTNALQNTILRGEWGFRGFVLTDFNLYDYMYVNEGLNNGTDMMLTFSAMKSAEDMTSPTARNAIRTAAHNVCYAVANSSAMNGIVPGSTVVFKPAVWENVRIAVDIVLAVLFILAALRIIIKKENK
jgi:beta-glucosidase